MKIAHIMLSSLFLLSVAYSSNWKTYTIKDGKFTIELPGEPKQQTQTLDTEFGKLDMSMLIYTNENSSYIVGFTDYPKSSMTTVNIDTFFENAKKGALKNTNGTLLQEKVIAYKTYPGREIKVSAMNGKAIILMRFFLAGNRFYEVLAALPPDEEYTENTKRFFDSFTIEDDAELPFIEQLLKSIGYNYEMTDKGNYRLVLKYEDQRTQLIHLTPFVSNVTSKEEYDVWSTVAYYRGPLPDTIYQKLLIKNGEADIGSFQTFKVDSGYVLVYSAVLNGKYDATILKKVILDVSGIADYFEEMITKKDKY